MAIKGKGRTKARQVPRAPRHQPVEVKPPLFTRRWVQVAGAFVLGIGAMMFLVWVTNGLREQDRSERARELAAAERAGTRPVVEAWSGAVDGAIGSIAQPGGPGIPPTLLSAASAAVDGIAAGDPVRGAAATLREADGALRSAVETLGGYALVEEIRDKGFDITQTNYLLNSRSKIVEGLELYRQTVAVAQQALEGDDRLGTVATGLRDQAVTLFTDGWRDLEQVKQSIGISPVAGAAGS